MGNGSIDNSHFCSNSTWTMWLKTIHICTWEIEEKNVTVLLTKCEIGYRTKTSESSGYSANDWYAALCVSVVNIEVPIQFLQNTDFWTVDVDVKY